MTVAADLKDPALFVPEFLEILEARDFTPNERFFRLNWDKPYDAGQFVEVSVMGVGEAPISISSSPTRGPFLEMCVRAVGNVTRAMQKLGPGDLLGIRGPFGRGFPYEEFEGRDVLFVAGGLGIIPLRSLIQYVIDRRDDYGKVTILYGSKNPGELLYPEETAEWAAREDIDFRVTVDRPDNEWKGNVGVITTLFADLEVDASRTAAAVVGPPVMYKFVVSELFELGIPAHQIWMSLERRMKCGVGKCGHCQINGKFCCLDGPVFNYAELQHLQEGI